MNDATNSERPSAILKNEHRTIERVLRVLGFLIERSRSGEGFELASLKRCVEFFRLFADACHHGKEEDLLFPVLESRGVPRDGGPIGVMLNEHRQARELTSAMDDALTAIESGDSGGEARFRDIAAHYITLLTNHIHKEDHVLFRMGDNVMTENDQDSLCSGFCEVACGLFGGQRQEELEKIADELESAYGLG